MINFLSFRRKALFVIASLFCVSLCSYHAYAEEPLLCADDIEKFCRDIKPGGGRILNCLKAHEAELTPSCREKMCELQGFIQGCEQACAADITRFCKEVKPGGGRIIKCLREHEKQLFPECSAKLEIIGKRFQTRGEEK